MKIAVTGKGGVGIRLFRRGVRRNCTDYKDAKDD